MSRPDIENMKKRLKDCKNCHTIAREFYFAQMAIDIPKLINYIEDLENNSIKIYISR